MALLARNPGHSHKRVVGMVASDTAKGEKMKGPFIPNKRTLFFVAFPDEGIYAAGPQGDVPGGPMAYLDRDMAQQVADSIGGTVKARSVLAAMDLCRKKQIVLYVRYADGNTGYVAETVPDRPNEQALIRIGEPERNILIEVANQQRRP